MTDQKPLLVFSCEFAFFAIYFPYKCEKEEEKEI